MTKIKIITPEPHCNTEVRIQALDRVTKPNHAITRIIKTGISAQGKFVCL